MRLARLELRAFGPFTDVTLDLGGEGRLHVVHGRNEAGKSTTLRALRGLLFGMPHVTVDAHVHAMRDLRVGAVLQDGVRGSLEVLRRKARKNDLLDLATETPLKGRVLADLLGGMDEKIFNAIYGLDHESLRRGGEALLKGEGDLGASLLDAGLGGPGVQQVLAALESEAQNIFRPTGSKPSLNRALAEWSASRADVNKNGVSATEWHARKNELAEIDLALNELEGRLEERAREKYRLERLHDVMAPLRRLEQARKERAALGQVAPLSEEDIAKRREAEGARDGALHDMERLTQQIDQLEGRLAELEAPDGLGDVLEDVVDDLRDRLATHRRARADMPGLQARLRQLEDDAQALLQRIRPGADLADAEALRLRSGLTERVRELAQTQGALAQGLGGARRRLASLREQHDLTSARLCAEVALDRPTDLDALPVPMAAEVDAWVDEFNDLAQVRRKLEDAREALAKRVADTERQLDVERRQGQVPTEEELAEARTARDALWQEVRAAGVEAGPTHAFEQAMTGADEMADRLRREASRVATQAHLLAELDAHRRGQEDLDRRTRELDGEERALRERWDGVWAPCGIRPAAPEAMRAWRHALEALRQRAVEVREAGAHMRECEAQLDAWKADWAACMGELGLPAETSAAEATAVVDDLKALIAKLEAATEQRRRLEALAQDARTLEARVDALVQAHAPELSREPLEDRAAALVERWHNIRSQRGERASRQEELEAAQEQRDAARQRWDGAVQVLDELMERAEVGELRALHEAEDRARRARELDDEVKRLETQILERGQGGTVAELAAQADKLEAADVSARIDALQRDLDELYGERQALAERRGHAKAELSALGGRSAAKAAEDAAEALARVKDRAHQYVRLRMASLVLRRELERYREQHQGPVLTRARAIFPRLTLGAYEDLKVGYGSDDEPVLVCVRADGKEVRPPELSDGTRDQLYLALRVATIAHHASSGAPLPFVLDDVFVHFDDERTRAGLEALAELAQSTQVLLFTHHARLVELAREAVPAERLCVHDLDALRGRAPSLPEMSLT
jgi:uncharacterized protein YhaN